MAIGSKSSTEDEEGADDLITESTNGVSFSNSTTNDADTEVKPSGFGGGYNGAGLKLKHTLRFPKVYFILKK